MGYLSMENFIEPSLAGNLFVQKSFLPREERPSHALIPSHLIPGLRRRLIVPKWWIQGLLFSFGKKNVWYDEFLEGCTSKGHLILNPTFKSKLIVPILTIWNEIINLSSHPKEGGHLSLPFHKYFKGTKKEIQKAQEDTLEFFMAPFFHYEIDPLHKKARKRGAYYPFRQIKLETTREQLDILSLELSGCLKNLLEPCAVKEEGHILTINPTIFQSMGKRITLKKLMDYLYLEYTKKDKKLPSLSKNFIPLKKGGFQKFHKDFLSLSSAFYDHGFLAWEASSPNKRISEIRKEIYASESLEGLKSDILCFWNPSIQTRDACFLEQDIEHKISHLSKGSKRAIDSIKEVHPSLEKPKKEDLQLSLFPSFSGEPPLPLKKVEAIEVKEAEKPGPSLKEGTPSKKPAVSNNLENLSDREFLDMVNNFYMSLKPLQRKFFEREREKMSPRKFRSYMISILRKRSFI
jgi:hypothetical protein